MKTWQSIALAAAGLAFVGVVAAATVGRPLVERAYHKFLYQPPPMVPDDLDPDALTVLYLHHSTGLNIWQGGVPELVAGRRAADGRPVQIVERSFPDKPYPWDNNPYDYWTLWVDHSGDDREQGQATLEDLVGAYDVVVWKNCFLAGDMVPDDGRPDVTSPVRTLANYRLQYEALRDAMRRFPETTFLVWTLPPKAQTDTDPVAAGLAREFAAWVRDEWDEPGDNIALWDYRAIAAPDDDLYLPARSAVGERDSHPNARLASAAAPLFVERLFDVIDHGPDATPASGVKPGSDLGG